jgi:hypothetical protein
LDICDVINGAANDDNPKEAPNQTIRALTRRLQDSDPNTISLTLTLTETCMKNCGMRFAECIQQAFMDEVVNVTRGGKGTNNAGEALRLIQQWGKAFEKKRGIVPIFFDTYVSLKSKGVRFPKLDDEVANTDAIYEPSKT